MADMGCGFGKKYVAKEEEYVTQVDIDHEDRQSEMSWWTPMQDEMSVASSWLFDHMSDGKHGMMPPEACSITKRTND